MNSRKTLFFKFFFIFISLNLSSNLIWADKSICVDDNLDLIDQEIKEPFVLKKLSFESDTNLSQSEFLYLVDLKENETITLDRLKNSCFYLKQKKRFSKICFDLIDCKDGKNLHFKLEGFWIFSKLEIEGIWFGKSSYAQNYILEPGDQFEEQKNQISIQKIEEQINNEGYLNASIGSKIFKNYKDKSITVKLEIDKGNRFSVKEVNFSIEKDNYTSEQEFEYIEDKIEKEFHYKFLKFNYSWKSINKTTKSLKKFLVRNGFPFASIKLIESFNYEKHQVRLEFKINLKNKKSYLFEGNNFFSDEEINSFLLDNYDISWDMPYSILSESITQLYRNKGFWNVNVKVEKDVDQEKFVINEGERNILKDVIIKGAEQIDSEFLKIKFFHNLLKQKYIDTDLLNHIFDNLISFYQEEGFWDAKIVSKDFTILQGESGKYKLNILIEEGKKRVVNQVKILDYPELESEDLFFKFKNLKRPRALDFNSFVEQGKWLQNYFQKKGYSHVEIKPEFQPDDQAKLNWKVDVGDFKARFGKTVVRAAGDYDFDNILREIKYKDNDEWDKDKIEQSYSSLNSLETFHALHMFPTYESDIEGLKPIILKFSPENQIEAKLRFGFQQVSKKTSFLYGTSYKVGASVLYRNPVSFGDQFRIDADVTEFQTSFVAQYKLPWIFHSPTRTLLKFFNHQYNQPLFIGSKNNLYHISQTGFLTGLSRKYNKFINLGFNFGAEDLKLSGLALEPAAVIDFSPDLIGKHEPYVFIEPNFLIDGLDDRINPRNGFLTSFFVKGMLSMSKNSHYFFKFLFEQSIFSSAIKPGLIAARIRLGHIFINKFSNLMPTERFFIGGATTLRSYEPDFAPPLGLLVGPDGKKQYIPQGGQTMINTNLEYRFPIFRNFGATVFQDFGILFKENFKASLLTATGFGVRYQTPIGPLRFDIGFRPKHHKDDSIFAWFLTLGNTF